MNSYKKDIVFIGLLFFIFSLFLSSFKSEFATDIWYYSDPIRFISSLVDRNSFLHNRTNLHPLFSLILLPFGLFTNFFDISALQVSRFIIALSASLSGILIFLVLIKIEIRRSDALTLLLLFSSTSSFQYWWSTPETFPIAGLSILPCFYLLSIKSKNFISWLFASVSSLSITVSNWHIGIYSALIVFRKRSFKVLFSSFVLVICLSLVQLALIPKTNLIFSKNILVERRFITFPNIDKFSEFFIYSGVIPKFKIEKNKSLKEILSYEKNEKSFDKLLNRLLSRKRTPIKKCFRNNSEQYLYNKNYECIENFKISELIKSPKTKNDYLFFIAAILWIIILSYSLIVSLTNYIYNPIIKLSLFSIFSQLVLHLIYGHNPFLYSAHYIIPIIFIISSSLRLDKNKFLFKYLIYCFIILAFINNINIFIKASAIANDII